MSVAEPDIDRIIATVEKVPDDLDKGQLLSDLESVISLYRHGNDLRYQPKRRQREAAEIVVLAKQLKMLLEQNRYPSFVQLPGDPGFKDLCKKLDGLCLGEQDYPPLMELVGVGKKVSAFENLAGSALRYVYEEHFKDEAGYTKIPDTQPPTISGPFIDFAEQVLEEFGIRNLGRPYSRGAIADAYRRCRKLNR